MCMLMGKKLFLSFQSSQFTCSFRYCRCYLSGRKIKDDAFRSQPGLGVFLKDFPFEVRYEVTGFTFTVGDDQDNVRTADCASALFTPRAKQLTDQYAKPGEMVTIDKIRVKDPSGKELKIPSLVYYIQ
jgi:hypothetical protein